jgi:hypothetical protein
MTGTPLLSVSMLHKQENKAGYQVLIIRNPFLYPDILIQNSFYF